MLEDYLQELQKITLLQPEEEAALEKSYEHLCALRDEVIAMGVLPPISEWHALNPNIK